MLSRLLLSVLGLALVAASAVPSRSQAGSSLGPVPTVTPAGRSWLGKWIWTPGEPSPGNSYTHFRKGFELASVPREPKVHITADSRYILWVNGTFVGRGPARSDRRWLYYDTWDLAPHLKKGRNVVAALVHHYGESTFQYMKGRGGLIADLTGFPARTLAKTDTTWRALRSAAWATGQPRMSLQLGFNEVYDARKELSGWQKPEFDDGAWPAAVEIGPAGMEPWPNLVPRDIPAMREQPVGAIKVLEVTEVTPAGEVEAGRHISQVMASGVRGPVRRVEVKSAEKLIGNGPGGAIVRTAPEADVSFLIDFGREVTGYPRFRVKGARGGEIIDMGYGEVLQDQAGAFIPMSADLAPMLVGGEVHGPRSTVSGPRSSVLAARSSVLGREGAGDAAGDDRFADAQAGGDARAPRALLNPDRDGVHYADRYVCKPGEQEFQTFDKRAFRYMQVDVRNAPEPIELDGVGLVFSTFPVEYKGSFECSDERLNRIWEIGRWTTRLNMEDGYTDSPWRERAQWWGDARVGALVNYYCFGDPTLIRKALRQKGQSLNEEGITRGVYPTDWDGGRLPSLTLIWVSTLWETYEYTGDRELVKELYPKVRYSLDRFFAPKVSDQGLLKDVPYGVFIDRAPVDDKGQSGALNAYYYDALRCAGRMGRLLNDPSAAEYDQCAEAVKVAMNRHLWDAQAHAYRDSILPDGKLSPKISQQTNSLCVLFDIAPPEERERILTYIYAPENKGKVVEAGSPYFSHYQLAALYHSGRHRQALGYIRERWGRMLDWGATTWWETWNPGAGFCRAWSAGPTHNLGAEVLGVKPLKPGFEEVAVAPQWVGLRYATGIVPTVKGLVKVAWQRDEAAKAAAVRVEIPEGVPAEVVLPNDGEVRVDRRANLPAGVTRLPSPEGTARFRMEKGGTTLFEVRDR
jgi:hypothetical protein